MTLAAITIFWLLVGWIVGQGLMAAYFMAVMARAKRRPAADASCPKTAVILCLRGADPFLETCVEALLDQDYPCYDVHVVIDSREDPAWHAVEAIVAISSQAPKIHVEALSQRRDTCSLKCSSIVQAVAGLDETYEVVALVDADTTAHRTWLRELVAPLADPGVGAATGNRWYMPADGSWGSLLRNQWNAAAIVQMYCYGIPWGGTLAVKTQLFRQSDLLDRWGRAFCEDTMLFRVLRQLGLRVAFVPSLLMVNRETCSIGGFSEWVRRQLLTARLYHPGWPAVVVHGLFTPVLLAASLAALAAALAMGQAQAAAWIGAGLAVYVVPLPLLLAGLEWSVRPMVAARGEAVGWLRPATAARMLPAIFATQTLYAAALLSAMTLRMVAWRGVRYQVDGPWRIRLLEYRPYTAAAPGENLPSSL